MPMNEKILIVDDDRDICEILSFNLAHEGYVVEAVYSAEEALTKNIAVFDLLLLDVMMGGMSGYKLAQHLRETNITVPIIFLTAKNTENDMLTGFSVGADDYISKPFSIKEVVARAKAVLRRFVKTEQEAEKKEVVSNYGRLEVNTELKEVRIDGSVLELTKKEYEILLLLATNQDKMFSREDIIDKLWKDTPYITERTVDVHITRLRKKMGDCATMIVNRAGYGYRFNQQ